MMDKATLREHPQITEARISLNDDQSWLFPVLGPTSLMPARFLPYHLKGFGYKFTNGAQPLLIAQVQPIRYSSSEDSLEFWPQIQCWTRMQLPTLASIHFSLLVLGIAFCGWDCCQSSLSSSQCTWCPLGIPQQSLLCSGELKDERAVTNWCPWIAHSVAMMGSNTACPQVLPSPCYWGLLWHPCPFVHRVG